MRKKTERILCCCIVLLAAIALVALAYFRSLPVLFDAETETNASGNASEIEPEGKIVYVTPSGTRYHLTQDCASLARSETVLETTEELAEAQGLPPCSRCKK